MAKKQFNTPQLDLRPELPQVVSRDFNLFYTPQAEPEIAGLKEFTNSLDSFVKGALTTGNIVGEKKLKEKSEAEAVDFFNMEVENKKAFNSAVNNNEIPREANPYFVDKLKELELGAKVQEFKNQFSQRYAKENLAENTDPNAFDLIYEEELKKFIKENNIGLYDAIDLEKNFFSKTSQFRDNTQNMHMNNQLEKIRQQFDKNYKIGIQDYFDPNAEMEDIGKNITDFIKEATKSGMNPIRARELFMETLQEYVEATGDFDFASKLLTELPKNIQLGTDVLANVNSLKDDFDKLEDNLYKRQMQEEQDINTIKSNEKTKQKLYVEELSDQYETLKELKDSDKWSDLSFSQKQIAEEIYDKRRKGFGQFNEPNVVDTLNDLIDSGNLDEAKEYLENNRLNLDQNRWYEYNEKIKVYQNLDLDTFVGNRQYNDVIVRLQTFIDDINNQYAGLGGKDIIGNQNISEFKEDINIWLASNPQENFKSLSERRDAFKAYTNARLKEYLDYLKAEYIDDADRTLPKPNFNNNNDNNIDTNTDTIDEFNPDELDNVDFPTGKVVMFIPEGLNRKQLREFKKKYPDAITYQDFIKSLDTKDNTVNNDKKTRKENKN